MVSYLLKLNAASFVEDKTRLGGDFNIKALFEQEPGHAMFVFMDLDFVLCKDPRNESSFILCFEMTNDWSANTRYESDMMKILSKFKLDDSVEKIMINHLNDFLLLKKPLQDRFKESEKPDVLKIIQLNKKFPHFNLDWLKMINSQRFKKSQLTDDDEIWIKNPELIQNLLDLIVNMDKK